MFASSSNLEDAALALATPKAAIIVAAKHFKLMCRLLPTGVEQVGTAALRSE
jgi:hypothetical protein